MSGSKMDAWLSKLPPAIAGASQQAADNGRLLDQHLWQLASSNERTLRLPNVNPKQRKWLHHRAGELGFTTKSTPIRKSRNKDMGISKPEGWSTDLSAVQHTPMQPARPSTKGAAKRERRRIGLEKMARWRTDCEECGKELCAEEALYHGSGAGPMCEDCVEADAKLSGYKWEPKSEFWNF